jgi:hypothetical protein
MISGRIRTLYDMILHYQDITPMNDELMMGSMHIHTFFMSNSRGEAFFYL